MGVAEKGAGARGPTRPVLCTGLSDARAGTLWVWMSRHPNSPQAPRLSAGGGGCPIWAFIFFFLEFSDFYFFHHSWFTVFCPFSTVQQVTQSHIHVYILFFTHYAPS